MPDTVAELLTWLKETAAAADRTGMPEIHSRLMQCESLIRNAYTVRRAAEAQESLIRADFPGGHVPITAWAKP